MNKKTLIKDLNEVYNLISDHDITEAMEKLEYVISEVRQLHIPFVVWQSEQYCECNEIKAGNPLLVKPAVMHSFIPQPADIERLMKEKLMHRMINDKLGWTGEYRMSAKDVLDVIIDLQNGA